MWPQISPHLTEATKSNGFQSLQFCFFLSLSKLYEQRNHNSLSPDIQKYNTSNGKAIDSTLHSGVHKKEMCKKYKKKTKCYLLAFGLRQSISAEERRRKKEKNNTLQRYWKKNMVYYTQKITVMIFSFSESMLKEIMFDINFYTPHLSRNDGI